MTYIVKETLTPISGNPTLTSVDGTERANFRTILNQGRANEFDIYDVDTSAKGKRWTGEFDGSVTPPVAVFEYVSLANLKSARLQELAQRRYAAEEGGTTLGGNPLATDRITQAKITSAYVKAVADDGFQITAWKSGSGVFSTLTAASIIAAANAIEAHVQACFDNEASLSGKITDAADLAELAAVDIEGGW
jgi:hypothetical protein